MHFAQLGNFLKGSSSRTKKKGETASCYQILFFHVLFFLFGPLYFILRIPSALFPLLALLLTVFGGAEDDAPKICFGNPLFEGNLSIFGYILFTMYFLSWFLFLFYFTPRFYQFYYITWHFGPSKKYRVDWRHKKDDFSGRDFVEDSKIVYLDIVMEKEGKEIVNEFFGKGIGGIIMSYVSRCFDDGMKEYYGIKEQKNAERDAFIPLGLQPESTCLNLTLYKMNRLMKNVFPYVDL